MTSLLHDIFTARVYPAAIVTPLHPMKEVSARLGKTVYQKREDQQHGRSFKIRGASAKILGLAEAELRAGVVCASAGNHAQGVARVSRMRGVHATIFMPTTAPRVKVAAVEKLGATVVLEGDHFDEACGAALAWRTKRGGAFVHPFEDRAVIAGQGTLGLEIVTQHPGALDAVFIPIGGGGLAAGVATALRILKPRTLLIGVEAEDASTMQAAFQAGRPVDLPALGQFADGAAVRRAGEMTYKLCRRFLDDLIVVNPDRVRMAVRDTWRDLGVAPEPAGALALAGLSQWSELNQGEGTLVAILSGANVDPEVAAGLIDGVESARSTGS